MNNFLQPVTAGHLLAESADDIDAIKTAAGYREAHFQHYCLPVLAAFAAHVQQLPLSDKAYHDARGAWKFGLTACLVALRFAETQLFFPNMESEERRKLEPQCRFAAFAAVLGSTVALLAQNTLITVGRTESEDEYHPLVTPITLENWLRKFPEAKFAWRTNGHVLTAAEGAAIASKFMPSGLLANFDLRVALMIFGSILPQGSPNGLETTLSKVVRQAMNKVLERYLEKDAARYQQKTAAVDQPGQEGKAVSDSLIAMSSHVERSNPLDLSFNAGSAPAPAAAFQVASLGSPASAEAMLANANPVLKEWFKALKSHERFSDLKNHLVTTERGTEVPISMLGFFGVNGPKIKKMMMDAGMVVDRSDDHRAIILHPALNPLLFGE